MYSQGFAAIAQRCKNSISPSAMSDRVLALILGWSPENFAIARVQDRFPVDALKAVARSFPTLGLDVDWILQEGANPHEAPPTLCKAEAPAAPFDLPSLQEMSAFVDAELARLRSAQTGGAA